MLYIFLDYHSLGIIETHGTFEKTGKPKPKRTHKTPKGETKANKKIPQVVEICW